VAADDDRRQPLPGPVGTSFRQLLPGRWRRDLPGRPARGGRNGRWRGNLERCLVLAPAHASDPARSPAPAARLLLGSGGQDVAVQAGAGHVHSPSVGRHGCGSRGRARTGRLSDWSRGAGHSPNVGRHGCGSRGRARRGRLSDWSRADGPTAAFLVPFKWGRAPRSPGLRRCPDLHAGVVAAIRMVACGVT
jgi:hypothetical protein